MKLTSLLVAINESTTDVSNLLDNIKYAGSRVQLLVYNNFCYDQKVLSELKEIASIWVENTTPFIYNYAECINELLRIADGEYICVIREDALICSDWLSTLLDTHILILNSGVISINDLSTSEGNYQLTIWEDLHWIYNKDFRINNFAFFRKDLIYKIGGFDTTLNGVFVFWDFCDRAKNLGFFNYFVPKTSMIRQSCYVDHFPETTLKEFNKRTPSSFFKIFKISPDDEKKIESLSNKYNKSFQYNDKLGCIVFSEKNQIDIHTLKELADDLTEQNLKMELYCSSYFENSVLRMSFVGILRPPQ